MTIDGKAIAADVLSELRAFIDAKKVEPNLLVLTSAPNFATKQFLDIKKRRAQDVGIFVTINELPDDVTTELVKEAVTAGTSHSDGIVLQLPFGEQVGIDAVLAHLPLGHDVDVIGQEAVSMMKKGHDAVLPPVVSAIRTIAGKHGISFEGKNVVVVGEGRLVGGPAALWLKQQNALVSVLNKNSKDIAVYTKRADVLVLGAGVPGLISKDMVKEGVVIFDAGTSEDAGELKGDAEPGCAEVAALMTPVPGGIGPITIAELFRNLLILQFGYEEGDL